MSEERNLDHSEYRYAVLMETNGKEYESWYYFIRYEGNEDALHHLSKQIESVDFYILDELSTFDLDLDHLVSEKTAKEMTKLELNAYMFHRKFDGNLQTINIGIKKKDKNDKKIVRFFEKLGIGRVEEFLEGEDIDPEDIASEHSHSHSHSRSDDSGSESGTDYNYEISESDSDDESPKKKKKEKKRRDSSDSESESDVKDKSPKIDKKLDKLKKKMR